MANPFLQRNLPLSELLAMQQRYSGEGNNGWYQQAQLRNTNEAIDQLGRRRQQPMMQPQRPQPMPRQMPQRPMQARPQPRPQPMPMPMMPSMPGVVSAAGMGASPGVSVTSGQGIVPPPMAWNALSLGGGGGGMMPPMGGGGMPGYGAQGGMSFGTGFRGFGAQQPYQGGGFARLY